jgi:hypothetical protein
LTKDHIPAILGFPNKAGLGIWMNEMLQGSKSGEVARKLNKVLAGMSHDLILDDISESVFHYFSTLLELAE